MQNNQILGHKTQASRAIKTITYQKPLNPAAKL